MIRTHFLSNERFKYFINDKILKGQNVQVITNYSEPKSDTAFLRMVFLILIKILTLKIQKYIFIMNYLIKKEFLQVIYEEEKLKQKNLRAKIIKIMVFHPMEMKLKQL